MGPWYVDDIKTILHPGKEPNDPNYTKAEKEIFDILSGIEKAVANIEKARDGERP